MAIRAINLIIWICPLIFLAGCFKDTEINQYRVEKSIRSDNAKLMIPVDLWDFMESLYTEEESTERVGNPEEGEQSPETISIFKVLRKQSKAETPFKYTSLGVDLTEYNYGVLGKRDHRLSFTKGGGFIDFADFVQARKEGSFRIHINPTISVKEADDFYVFYWGNGRQRKVSGDIYGSDCKQFLDISSFFKNRIFLKGLSATTHKMKYITSLAGTYIFIVKKDGALHIAQLTMYDSRFPLLHCRKP